MAQNGSGKTQGSKDKGHGGKGSPNRPSRTNRPSRGPKHGPDKGYVPKP